MLSLNREGLKKAAGWKKAGIRIPSYDISAMRTKTLAAPEWLHFGTGNIFRGFIAALQDDALNEGRAEKGIIAAAPYDYETISRIYEPYDNLTLVVTMSADGTADLRVAASVAAAFTAKGYGLSVLGEYFRQKTLKASSFTITEKGYALRDLSGKLLEKADADFKAGPAAPVHVMAVASAMLHERFLAGGFPIAMVSMDNCSHNGETFRASVLEIAKAWERSGKAASGFYNYVSDEKTVSFPWTMIDKITPRPADSVADKLTDLGIWGMVPVKTAKNTYTAPFVNTEEAQYLIIENSFPNGCPIPEGKGVFLTDRETVQKTERMKVTACLNPLHTSLAIFGCLLGYKSIAEEMKDPELTALIRRIGYEEGLPAAANPGIIDPKAFLDEVITKRFPNPFIPDTPQRIATDTSQKVGVRFGETIKAYGSRADGLEAIPLVIAGWLRYLLGLDDEGNVMELSPDPLLKELDRELSGLEFGRPESVKGKLGGLLSNESVFGTNLVKAGLAPKIEAYLARLIEGRGSVRKTLRAVLTD